MHIQVIPNRGSPPAILLRESYREGGKVKKRTLLNLTHWPPDLLEGFKALLRGGTVIPAPASPEVFTIRRALPHGHVAAELWGDDADPRRGAGLRLPLDYDLHVLVERGQ